VSVTYSSQGVLEVQNLGVDQYSGLEELHWLNPSFLSEDSHKKLSESHPVVLAALDWSLRLFLTQQGSFFAVE